ncbi:centriolar coiled-coil protein of 110 kDa [Denticeps clupeoides]|uniref:Centriolar coiled-coil protein of 110 kDa-like n=1 Tax=Denticeps clupeoides TaxID=299321 RepID=A0AAY4CIT0_9TELE|nr:centriolar coiled-coil protein of 110 kDa-like [Denticeps clupeoides]
MESYEDFCLRNLSRLQSERSRSCCFSPRCLVAPSIICFHGRAVLSPLLDPDQHREMCVYRRRAVQREAEKEEQRRTNLLIQVQNILDEAQSRNEAPEESDPPVALVCSPPMLEQVMEVPQAPVGAGRPLKATGGRDVESDDGTVTLQSLLHRSRQYVEQQQVVWGSKVSSAAMESRRDEERQSSPVGETSATRESLSVGSCELLCHPEPTLILRPHRSRPRPVSAGNIVFPFPAHGNGRGGAERLSPDQAPDAGTSRRGSALGESPDGLDGFRRRCHTLDSQINVPGAPVDRSQERVPRFMAGVPQRPAPRRSPPTLRHLQPAPETPDPLTSPGEGRVHRSLEENSPEEAQWRVQALAELQWRLEEEHTQQLSLLLAEQEREQQRLRQELEDKDRRLREQGVCAEGGAERYPALSPAERSPAHSPYSLGFRSPLSSRVATPTATPTAYLWGSSKPRNRLSLVLTVEQQRAMCHLTAIARGFLTRRLLKTDKVKNLRQTVQDTQEFIRSFQTEVPQKRGSLSTQDLSLQERVRAQLRAALYDIHEIFFELSLEERFALLQQARDLRTERKLREMEKAKSRKERVCLSAATQKSLDRKKQRVGDSPGQTRKVQQKLKTPSSTNRILQPSQGQNAPAPGPLLRQGSWYRKTPEERAKRSENLKKQLSLG